MSRKKKALTAAQILGADDAGREPVEVPEWGGTVYIQAVNPKTRTEMLKLFSDNPKNAEDLTDEEKIVRFVAACTVDENGELIFKTQEKIDALLTKNFKIFLRLFYAINKMSSVTADDIKEEVKNLKPSPSVDSTTN